MHWLNWLVIAIGMIFVALIPIGILLGGIGLWQTGNIWARVISVGYFGFAAVAVYGLLSNILLG